MGMKKYKLIVLAVLLIVLTVPLTGCLPGMEEFTQEAPAGFLHGVWHGWCAPVSLVCRALGMEVTMFEPVNTGLSYELGFYMAVISGFGGLSLMRRKRRD